MSLTLYKQDPEYQPSYQGISLPSQRHGLMDNRFKTIEPLIIPNDPTGRSIAFIRIKNDIPQNFTAINRTEFSLSILLSVSSQENEPDHFSTLPIIVDCLLDHSRLYYGKIYKKAKQIGL